MSAPAWLKLEVDKATFRLLRLSLYGKPGTPSAPDPQGEAELVDLYADHIWDTHRWLKDQVHNRVIQQAFRRLEKGERAEKGAPSDSMPLPLDVLEMVRLSAQESDQPRLPEPPREPTLEERMAARMAYERAVEKEPWVAMWREASEKAGRILSPAAFIGRNAQKKVV